MGEVWAVVLRMVKLMAGNHDEDMSTQNALINQNIPSRGGGCILAWGGELLATCRLLLCFSKANVVIKKQK